ncbi:MAG: ABC transporter permease [Isosphaeraceae bacterium]
MNIHKVYVIATTEFGSAIRTKSFLIGLLLLPVIMGASILIQKMAAERVDTRPRVFAVLDHSGGVEKALESAAQARNAAIVGTDGRPKGPRFDLVPSGIETAGRSPDEVRLALSDRVRRGELYAFVEIPAGIEATASREEVKYYSDNPNDDALRSWLTGVVNDSVRTRRYEAAKIDRKVAEVLARPVPVENLGLVARDTASQPTSGGPAGAATPSKIKAAEKVDPIRAFAVPAVLLFVSFFVVMTSAPQLLNSVLEEKMSRISEVLLGSASPFELMLGKLLGNVALALLLAALYVGGAYLVAVRYGYGDLVRPDLVAALAVFMPLAVLLYGSLYLAVGASCSELKDAQSLMMPVMLLSMLPMFVWTVVLRDPASPLSVGLSLFPPSTPYLMLMRMAMRPTPPVWQIGLGIGLTTLTSLACVWAAGKIFRTGLLMHGKPPSLRELARWVIAR